MSNVEDKAADVKVEKRKRRRNVIILMAAIPLVCLCALSVTMIRDINSEDFPITSTARAVALVTAAAEKTAVAVEDATTAARPSDTPSPTSTPGPTDTPPPPTDTPEPDGRSREAPAMPGSVVSVEEIELSVDHVFFPTDADLRQADRFNPTAEDGKRLLMVYVGFTCDKSGTETCRAERGDFEAYGSAGEVYQPIYNVDGFPDELDDLEFFGGATAVKWVAFQVGADETDFVLAYEPFLSLDQAYLRLPDEEAVEAGN